MDYFETAQKAVDRIEEHLSGQVRISDLAKAVYCSEAHFCRIFRAIVGTSVMEYARGRRLSAAGTQLWLTNEKVINIALKYGYETPQAFSKAFKRFHGKSPNACRKSGTGKYLERSFPLVKKIRITEGAAGMRSFGSPLEQILQDMGKQSANMYFCFNIGVNRYAIQALKVWTVWGPWDLYYNTEGKLFQFLGGNNRPVICIDSGIDEIVEGKKNVLQCRTKDAPRGGNTVTTGDGVFGLLIDGIPELKIIRSAAPIQIDGKPYIISIGRFDDEETSVIDTGALWRSQTRQIADSFDKVDESPICPYIEKDSLQKRLEYAAYQAELLARNASIEAANGKEHHRGTMVVAFELHQHAMEIAQIAREMRESAV